MGPITARHQERGVFTPEEMMALFPVGDAELVQGWGSLQYAALFYVLASTGLCSGEACALRWRHVDLENEILIVEGTKTRTSRRPALLTERGKRLLIALRPGVVDPDGYLFPGKRPGTTLDRRSPSQRLRKVLAAQKISRVGGNLVVHSF